MSGGTWKFYSGLREHRRHYDDAWEVRWRRWGCVAKRGNVYKWGLMSTGGLLASGEAATLAAARRAADKAERADRLAEAVAALEVAETAARGARQLVAAIKAEQ